MADAGMTALPRDRRFVFAAAAWVVVTLTALAANRGSAVAGAAMVLACVGLPWLIGPRHVVARALAVRRRGWLIAAALATLSAVLPCLVVVFLVRVRLGALVLCPPIDPGSATVLAQAPVIGALACAEEVFFRGFLQETVAGERWGALRIGRLSAKNLAAATLFGVAHAVALGSPAGLLAIASGLLLGWLVERSGGSVWPAVMLHAAANIAFAWNSQLLTLNLPGPPEALLGAVLDGPGSR